MSEGNDLFSQLLTESSSGGKEAAEGTAQLPQGLTEWTREDLARSTHGTYPVPCLTELQAGLMKAETAHVIILGREGSGKSIAGMQLGAAMMDKEPNVRFFVFSAAALVQGTAYRGTFARRIAQVLGHLTEIGKRARAIVFVDEASGLSVGATDSNKGDHLYHTLKTFLTGPGSHGVHFVLATTTQEFATVIRAQDPAFARRFLPIHLPEPRGPAMTACLEHRLPVLRDHHGVDIDPAMGELAISLADQFLAHLAANPARTVQLLDTACCHARLNDEPALTEARLHQTLSALTRRPIEARYERVRKLINRAGSRIKAELIGRDPAVDAIMRTTTVRWVSTRGVDHVLASGLMTGNTGSGKTLLALKLAEHLFGDPNRLCRVDCADLDPYTFKARLIEGMHGREGLLPAHVRQHGAGVFLFDEIEKALYVNELLLALLDKGEVGTDTSERLSARSYIVLITSNLLNAKTLTQRNIGFGDAAAAKQLQSSVLRERLAKAGLLPELVARVDHVFLFPELSPAEQREVLAHELGKQAAAIPDLPEHVRQTLANTKREAARLLRSSANRRQFEHEGGRAAFRIAEAHVHTLLDRD